MNFDFSDEAKELGEQARKLFAGRAGTGAARKAMADGAPAMDAALWNEIAQLGWTAARVPEAHGGLGLTVEEVAQLAEAAGGSLAHVPLVSTLLATEALVLAGTDAQQARWLPGIASGDIIAAAAWSEPGGVSPATVKTRASGGSLTGIKQPVADLGLAQVAVVAAAGPDGPQLYIVDLGGADVAAVETVDLVRRHGRLTLNDTPAEALGTASDYQDWLDRAAIILAYEAIGTAHSAMTMTVDYAKTRSAFGQKIGRYQAV